MGQHGTYAIDPLIGITDERLGERTESFDKLPHKSDVHEGITCFLQQEHWDLHHNVEF
jgi:hypothetical protein